MLERLAELGIDLLPVSGLESHFLFVRGEIAALVERAPGGFGGVGSGGLLTEGGLAPLVWRSGGHCFVRKGFERPASDAEVEAVRRFSSDLNEALQFPLP